jgi:hypothetical protein
VNLVAFVKALNRSGSGTSIVMTKPVKGEVRVKVEYQVMIRWSKILSLRAMQNPVTKSVQLSPR